MDGQNGFVFFEKHFKANIEIDSKIIKCLNS